MNRTLSVGPQLVPRTLNKYTYNIMQTLLHACRNSSCETYGQFILVYMYIPSMEIGNRICTSVCTLTCCTQSASLLTSHSTCIVLHCQTVGEAEMDTLKQDTDQDKSLACNMPMNCWVPWTRLTRSSLLGPLGTAASASTALIPWLSLPGCFSPLCTCSMSP